MSYSYSDSREYRDVFRKLTNQSTSPPENTYDVDEETLDENHYDETRVSAFLDAIYKNTKGSALFCTLYDLAAAEMISTNHEIGLAVLCSYDYLGAFYNCYQEYLLSPETFNDQTQTYKVIHGLLTYRS
jgi:hypothetical protein